MVIERFLITRFLKPVVWKLKVSDTYFGAVKSPLRCGIALEVWNLSGLLIETQGVHWHLKFVQQMGNDLLELVIATSWSMWLNRNVVQQGKTWQLAAMVLQKARMLLDEFQVANAQTI